jgi:hypothetical protein
MATVKHRPSKSVYLRTVLYFRAFTRETLLAVMLMTVGIGLTLLTAMAVQVHSGRLAAWSRFARIDRGESFRHKMAGLDWCSTATSRPIGSNAVILMPALLPDWRRELVQDFSSDASAKRSARWYADRICQASISAHFVQAAGWQ